MGAPYEQQDFANPAETREFPNGRVDLLRIGGADIGRLTLAPGWRWSTDVKPVAGTELCEAPHFQYHVSGTLRSNHQRRGIRRHARASHRAALRPRRLGCRRHPRGRRGLVGRLELRCGRRRDRRGDRRRPRSTQ